jgi:hypothetical protein
MLPAVSEEIDHSSSREPPQSAWRRIMRSPLPKVLLFGGLAAILIPMICAQPVAVDVVYDLGPARRELRVATMRYLLEGDEVIRVRFDYAVSGAGRTQLHSVRLPRGEYTVELALAYRGDVPRVLRGAAVSGKNEARLVRPLAIRGKGQVTIVVAGD